MNNRSEKPLVNYGGISAQTGVASNIEVSREIYTNLPYPFSDCREDLTAISSDSLYFNLSTSLGNYTQNLCVDIYNQINVVLANCKCYDGAFKMNISGRICQNTTEISKFVGSVHLELIQTFNFNIIL